MSKQSRIIKPETNEIPKELLDLATVIAELPAEHLEKVEPALEKVVESTKRRRKILSLVQDALSQLRLDMKYLAFDLEATRRERDDYRRQLEETS
ncbi:MAG TPA: transcriptional regulator [Thermoguttaceae bacterium]|nr:transcriptional regulator [Thermoguttaceae bacterium]